jgi:hypothetical protein
VRLREIEQMKIIRTAKFNKDCKSEKIKEVDVEKLENELEEEPEKGKLIQGTGGLRKIRMSIDGKGKSGGARVIYYYQLNEIVFLITLYKKNTKENISNNDKNKMKKIVEQIKQSLK